MFEINPKIAADSQWIARHKNLQLRLMNDERFFWVLILPELDHLSELHDLDPATYGDLMALARNLGAAMKSATGAVKINTAAIGNIVTQLHLHIVARHHDDAAWPAPVWGHGHAMPLAAATADQRIQIVKKCLAE
jgi:diadenosine tetraphosphate (Ap4A) HIT family hydrolase